MAKRPASAQSTLFALFEPVMPAQPVSSAPRTVQNVHLNVPSETCSHEREKSITVWPGETFDRLTWTCKHCGFVWGRA